jgi:hypothetical protein
MSGTHRAAPPALRVVVLVLSLLVPTVGLSGAAGAAERPAGEQATTVKGTTIRLADGGVEWFIDPAIVKEARAQALGAGYPKCGTACDGKDPNSYMASGYIPGSGWQTWSCATGATTIYRYHPSPYANDPYVELRWSPKCETSWARGCCFTWYMLRGFTSSTGGERSRTYGGTVNNPQPEWTSMLDNSSPLVAQACYDGQIGGSPLWRCGSKW